METLVAWVMINRNRQWRLEYHLNQYTLTVYDAGRTGRASGRKLAHVIKAALVAIGS